MKCMIMKNCCMTPRGSFKKIAANYSKMFSLVNIVIN